ncbi:hypothetical protein [Oscillatoria sp. HE19RPO]|uniref:hypothetical protein n=1 Tax=Oscillatoria sp. HE19RPO TaxID=2954806 RepID=UPI0020C200E7|nr:hypothetical protein [Oscillatoria sp. HE19RPO]
MKSGGSGDRLGLNIPNMGSARLTTPHPTTLATECNYFSQRLDWGIFGQSEMDKTLSPSGLKREIAKFSPIPGK